MTPADCSWCHGPCRVPEWAKDSSRFPNDIFGYQAFIARVHSWVTPERLAEVERIRSEIRAMVLAPAFPCVGCGRYAFAEAGVSCYWCQRGR